MYRYCKQVLYENTSYELSLKRSPLLILHASHNIITELQNIKNNYKTAATHSACVRACMLCKAVPVQFHDLVHVKCMKICQRALICASRLLTRVIS